MTPSQELVDEAATLLGAGKLSPNFEEQARMDGLSSGRLGWIRVKARTQSALLMPLFARPLSTFQDNEFDRFGVTTRLRETWLGSSLIGRTTRGYDVMELPKTLNLGDSLRAPGNLGVRRNQKGSYHGILGYHLMEKHEKATA